MPRRSSRDPSKQKYTISITTAPTVYAKLVAFGGDNFTRNIGAFFELLDAAGLFDQVLDARTRFDAEQEKARAETFAKVRDAIVPSLIQRTPEPSPGKPVETFDERKRRIAQNTLAAIEGAKLGREQARQRELAAAIDEHFALSQKAFETQRPLPKHEALMFTDRAIYDAVMQRCRETFGWESGPRPPGVISPIERQAAVEIFGPDDPPPPGVKPLTPDQERQIEQWAAESGHATETAEGGAGGPEGTPGDAAGPEHPPVSATVEPQF